MKKRNIITSIALAGASWCPVLQLITSGICCHI